MKKELDGKGHPALPRKMGRHTVIVNLPPNGWIFTGLGPVVAGRRIAGSAPIKQDKRDE